MHRLERVVVVALFLSAGCAIGRPDPVQEWSQPAVPKTESKPADATPPVANPGNVRLGDAKAERPPRIFGELTMAGGVYSHNTRSDGSAASGHADAAFGGMRCEYVFDRGIGGGISLEGTGSDNNLFGDTGPIDVRGRTGDAFLYFVGVPTTDADFRIPMRAGPYFHSVVLDDDRTSLQTRWNGVGLRIEVEPEVWLIRSGRFAFGLVGGASAGVHFTQVKLKGGGGETTFDGSGATLGGEAGFQALWGQHVTTRLGYLYRVTREDESDPKGGLTVNGVNATFNGVMLSVGVRF
jgi:hypothetical protein